MSAVAQRLGFPQRKQLQHIRSTLVQRLDLEGWGERQGSRGTQMRPEAELPLNQSEQRGLMLLPGW